MESRYKKMAKLKNSDINRYQYIIKDAADDPEVIDNHDRDWITQCFLPGLRRCDNVPKDLIESVRVANKIVFKLCKDDKTPSEDIRAELFETWDLLNQYLEKNCLNSKTPPAEQNGGQKNKISKEAKVLAVLTDNPELSDTDIAKKAGVNRTSLYKMKKYMKAKEILKSSKADFPKGSKSKDSDIEAWD